MLTNEEGDRKLHNGYKIKWSLNRALIEVYSIDGRRVRRKRSGINDFPVRPGRPKNAGKEWRISIMETHPPWPVLNFSSDKGAFCRYQIRVTPWWRHISTNSRRCVSTYSHHEILQVLNHFLCCCSVSSKWIYNYII